MLHVHTRCSPIPVFDVRYVTAAFGKDHFGWNDTSNHGIDHGYASTLLYDGLGGWTDKKTPPAPHNWTGEFDDYDQVRTYFRPRHVTFS